MAIADHQTAGRGRLGRTWEAPVGSSLLMSLLLRPAAVALERRHLVVAAVALAGSDACAAVAGVEPGLKWPNDLLVDDRKLAGVLAEADGERVVVGIGINLNWADDLPAGGIALNQAAGLPAGSVDRDAVAAALLDGLAGWYGGRDGGWDGRWDAVADAYRSRCVTLGRKVRVELPERVVTGRAIDVTSAGHLVVQPAPAAPGAAGAGAHGEGGASGAPLTISAGDVIHLRPA